MSRGITEYIETRYHEDLRNRFPLLISKAKSLSHLNDFPKTMESFLVEFFESMKSHMLKEEKILFPMIDAGKGRLAKQPISCMESEHNEHLNRLLNLRNITQDFSLPPQAGQEWQQFYLDLKELEIELMDHINLENDVLFSRALNE